MSWWHGVLSTVGRMPMFDDVADRRRALRAIARVVAEELALVTIVDDHLHLVFAADAPGRVTQAVRLALGALPGFVPLQPTWTGEVATRAHAETLLGYTLGQSAKHKLPGHPARWEGSSLADLVGARVLPGFDPTTIVRLLPRFRADDALRVVGVRAIPALTPDGLRGLGAAVIARAGAAAYAVPALVDHDSAGFAARSAVAVVQRDAGIPASETSFSLAITLRSANRLRASLPSSAGDVLRRRLGLDAAVAR